jgi:hypothetical protein
LAPAARGELADDETYVKVRGKWSYLYRAVDKLGTTIDFYLSPTRNTTADALASELAPEILALRARGSEIPQALNECGRPSARGGRWAAGTLLRLLRRTEKAVATGPTREIRE